MNISLYANYTSVKKNFLKDVIRRTLHLSGLPPKEHITHLSMRKTSDRPKLRNVLLNT